MVGGAQSARSGHRRKLHKRPASNHLRGDADQAMEGTSRVCASLLKFDLALARYETSCSLHDWDCFVLHFARAPEIWRGRCSWLAPAFSGPGSIKSARHVGCDRAFVNFSGAFVTSPPSRSTLGTAYARHLGGSQTGRLVRPAFSVEGVGEMICTKHSTS
jgi:hypothetical protein